VVGWGEIEIKAKLSPAEAGVWAELGNILYLFSFLNFPKTGYYGVMTFVVDFLRPN
jgi:hypothetical protein